MNRRAAIAVVVLAGIVGLFTYALTSTVLSAWVLGMGTGSPAFAKKWQVRLEPFTDADASRTAYPEVEVIRFGNGEWVIGVSSDSHASHWGGTVVVKDSTGRVRAFFGHVCGPRFLSRLQETKSLMDFYGDEQWQHWHFHEYPIP